MTKDYTQLVANDWKQSVYYDLVEDEESLALFWGEDSVFHPMFGQLDLANVIEIACGHGRHYTIYGPRAGTATLIDVNIENIDFCRKRFGGAPKPPILLQNSGNDSPGLEDEAYSAVFCYDAMVHFELFDVIDYLRESFRVLAPNGRALFHHSNFTGAPGIPAHRPNDFGWRNYMSADLFTHIAMRTGFSVERQNIISWGGMPNLDCVTLLQKAS